MAGGRAPPLLASCALLAAAAGLCAAAVAERPPQKSKELTSNSTLCNLLSGWNTRTRRNTQCPTPCTPCAACPPCPTCRRPIPPGYEHFPGLGYYRLHTVPEDWMSAKVTCEREGAHLAIINSQEEAELMKSFFARDLRMGDWMYLGFHDLLTEGKYITVLGQPLSQTGYVTWNTGQPDNANDEDCGSMYPSGGLNDLTCSFKQVFVCELIT